MIAREDGRLGEPGLDLEHERGGVDLAERGERGREQAARLFVPASARREPAEVAVDDCRHQQ